MARFTYTGRDTTGKKSGKLTAASRREAMQRLKSQGIRIIELTEVPETLFTKDVSIGNPVKLQHFVIFLRQFATLLKAGVTVVDATHILAVQTDSKPLAKALESVEQDLREGIPLSSASAKHKKIFAPIFINMIKAGEVGGTLDTTLERLADQFEKQQETKQKISSALSYPIMVGIVAIAVVIFLLTNVVPTFANMFTDFGGELPAITQFVLDASDFMQRWWYVIVLFMVVLAVGISVGKKNKKTKYQFDYFMLRMPIFGKMMQKAVLARMTRTLSSLFASSVPILQSMNIVEQVVENEVISRVIREARNSLEKGQSIAEPMKKHWAFPPLVTQMISIGEATGSLDSMLSKVADFYEKEVDLATDKLKSLIEPLMIVLLAGIVGVIVTSIMVPMFEIFNQVDNM